MPEKIGFFMPKRNRFELTSSTKKQKLSKKTRKYTLPLTRKVEEQRINSTVFHCLSIFSPPTVLLRNLLTGSVHFAGRGIQQKKEKIEGVSETVCGESLRPESEKEQKSKLVSKAWNMFPSHMTSSKHNIFAQDKFLWDSKHTDIVEDIGM